MKLLKTLLVILCVVVLVGPAAMTTHATPPVSLQVESALVTPLKGKLACVPAGEYMTLSKYLGPGNIQEALSQLPSVAVQPLPPAKKLKRKRIAAFKKFLATGLRRFKKQARNYKSLLGLQNLCTATKTPYSSPPEGTPTPLPDLTSPDLTSPAPECEIPWAALPSGPCLTEDDCSVESSGVDAAMLEEVGVFDTYPVDGLINGMSFYVVAKGNGELVSLKVTRSQSWNNHRAVLRVFDPDERIVYWKLQTQKKNQGGEPIAPIVETLSPTEPPPPAVFQLKKPGIYEVRLSTNSNAKLSLKLSPGTSWGFSPQNGNLRKSNWSNFQSTLYAWIPSHPTLTTRLFISGAPAGLAVFRDDSNTALNINQLVIPPGLPDGGEVWRFELGSDDVRYFKLAHGIPLILSKSREEALELKSALTIIPDGPLAGFRVAHRFQRELARLLPSILQEISQTPLTLSDVSLSAMQDPECKNPVSDDDVYRYSSLLGYGYNAGTLTSAAWALSSQATGELHQQIDPTKPWLGGLGLSRLGRQTCGGSGSCLNGSNCVGGFCAVPFNPAVDRWDVERGLTYEDLGTSDPTDTIKLRGGISPSNGVAHGLAFAAITDTPCNPFRSELIGTGKKRNLIARAALSFAIDLMRITESELVLADGADSDPYPTINMFGLAQVLTPKFEIVSQAVSEGFPGETCGKSNAEIINATLAAGMRRIIDRQLGHYNMSNGNQHAHAIIAFKQFANGFQFSPTDSLYQQLSDQAADDFAATQNPAGYWAEASGPDASYIGMTNNIIANYYRRAKASQDLPWPQTGAALNASYNLFNHTVAPEKTGALQGAFNFNHRISTGFDREQWGGAKGTAEDLPSVGIWGPVTFTDIAAARASLVTKVNQFASHAGQIGAMGGGDAERFLYLDSSARDPEALFPYQEPSFTRQFGDEFIFVKKPAYMASIYVGKPAGSVEGIHREQARIPQPYLEDIDPDEDPNNDTSISVYQNTPLTGGGLSMFWTPQFGSSILGGSWSPLVHHGLMATIAGKRYWEDYYKTDYSWVAQSNLLFTSGMLENSALQYARVYAFAPSAIQVTVTLTALEPFASDALVENIPFMTCTRDSCAPSSGVKNRKAFGSTIVDLNGTPIEGEHVLTGFRVVDTQGDGVEVVLDAPRTLRVFPHGLREVYYNSELQIGRVQIVFPSTMTNGQSAQLQYTIAPLVGS